MGDFHVVVVRLIFVGLMVVSAAAGVGAQTPARTPNVIAAPQASPSPSPTPARQAQNNTPPASATAEQIAEGTIFIYGLGGGRVLLDQIRKTTIERGKTTFTADDGKTEQASYQRFVIRGSKLEKDKIRLDQDFPNARYALVQNEDKLFGLLNRTRFDPRDDAAKAFENAVFRGPDMLLRYKENESTLVLAGKDKEMGVEMHLIDVTDKKGRTARFHISAKSYRIMAISYEDGGVKYKRKFYNHNSAQGTLVPYRIVLTANGKVIEETEIGTITFGQKVDENLFSDT